MTEWEIIEHLMQTRELLAPLQRDSVLTSGEDLAGADLMLSAFLKGADQQRLLFLVEVKASSTPQTVQNAVHQIQSSLKRKNDPEMNPMIVVPYLSESRLKELEEAQVSGIDLCGNGIVIIPERLFIYRTGNKNRYPESRTLNNPFRGRSAMVARALLSQPHFESMSELHAAIQAGGVDLSFSQVSKAISALEQEIIVSTSGRSIHLRNPLRLLERLSLEWRSSIEQKVYLRVINPRAALANLTRVGVPWAVTGESSVSRYTAFGEGRPMRIAVSKLSKAVEHLKGTPEAVPHFADIELIETTDAGFFFQNQCDDEGMRWASPLQTWIELNNGDGRQQDAAREIRDKILREIKR